MEVAISPLPSPVALKRAEWLHNTVVWGGPKKKGGNQKWRHQLCLWGGPQLGDKIRSGYITAAFSRCPKEGGVAT